MTRDHLFHKLVLHTIRTQVLMREIVSICDNDPKSCAREMACDAEATKLIYECAQYQPTIEQLKEWEKVKV